MGYLKMKSNLICKEKDLDHCCLLQFILIKFLQLLYSLVSYIHLSSLLQNLRLVLHLILGLITMQSRGTKYHHPQLKLGGTVSVMSLIS